MSEVMQSPFSNIPATPKHELFSESFKNHIIERKQIRIFNMARDALSDYDNEDGIQDFALGKKNMKIFFWISGLEFLKPPGDSDGLFEIISEPIAYGINSVLYDQGLIEGETTLQINPEHEDEQTPPLSLIISVLAD